MAIWRELGSNGLIRKVPRECEVAGDFIEPDDDDDPRPTVTCCIEGQTEMKCNVEKCIPFPLPSTG